MVWFIGFLAEMLSLILRSIVYVFSCVCLCCCHGICLQCGQTAANRILLQASETGCWLLRNAVEEPVLWYCESWSPSDGMLGEVMKRIQSPVDPRCRPQQVEAAPSLPWLWTVDPTYLLCSQGLPYGHHLEIVMWCWDHLDGLHDWTPLRPL